VALSAYSSAYAYTVTIHNNTDRKVKLYMDPSVLSRRKKVVEAGKTVNRNIGGMCIKRFVAEDIDKKKMFKAQKNIDRTQQMKGRKSHYYVTGSRCKSHDVYIYDKDGVFYIDMGEEKAQKFMNHLKEAMRLARKLVTSDEGSPEYKEVKQEISRLKKESKK
jgi:hypothetical protein